MIGRLVNSITQVCFLPSHQFGKKILSNKMLQVFKFSQTKHRKNDPNKQSANTLGQRTKIKYPFKKNNDFEK